MKAATPTRGVLVSIDGPNGVGKTSTVAGVAAALAAQGLRVHRTREPTDTELGTLVRSGQERFSGRVLACLVAADRHTHVESELVPRLADHDVVLCDRYLESSLALQFLDGVSREYVLAIHESVPFADLSVVLVAEPQVIANRLDARGRSSRFERTVESSERERGAYLEVAALLSTRAGGAVFVLDNSALSPTDVNERVTSRVLQAVRPVC